MILIIYGRNNLYPKLQMLVDPYYDNPQPAPSELISSAVKSQEITVQPLKIPYLSETL
jgi:hypothetical protein